MQAPYDPRRPFDRAAAYRFSLAFQCVVNIGVRGSEAIRARVVQAGTLDVVGCVLEAWPASKGFAVAPSASASGKLDRALQRQVGNVGRIDDVCSHSYLLSPH